MRVEQTTPEEQAALQFKIGARQPTAPAQAAAPAPKPSLISRGLGAVDRAQQVLAKPLTKAFELAGKADVAQGLKTPAQAERRAELYGRGTTNLAEATAMPWSRVPWLGRLALNALLGGVQTLGSLKEKGIGAGIGAAAGGLGELVTIPSRLSKNAAAATRETETVAAKNTAAKSAYESLKNDLKAAFEDVKVKHAEQAAASIVADYKRIVPAWKDFPNGVKGLQEMVVGKGQEALSISFDKAMKEAAKAGTGKQVFIDPKDAASLGIKVMQGAKDPAITKVGVDGGELARRATGFWKTDPTVYRRAIYALDKAGLGDPAAREEYKIGQSLINFIDKSGALKGGTFHPEAIVNGLHKVKLVNELRRRGMGDVFRGHMQAALKDVPQPPAVPPAPTPQEVTGIKTMKNPIAAHPFSGAAIAEGLAAVLGHHGFGVPGALGYGAALLSPRELVTQAPLTAKEIESLGRSAGLSGAAIRQLLQPSSRPPNGQR